MAIPVVSGATIICTMGLAPGVLTVTSQSSVLIGGKPSATVSDTAPLANVGPCGMCVSMANPLVAAATAAALGVLTPQPCIPSPAGAWVGGNAPPVAGSPGLANDANLICLNGGCISIMDPGQSTVVYG